VKLLSHSAGKFALRLDSREYDALLAALGLRAHLSRTRRSLTTDTATDPKLRAAQADFDAALGEFQKELTGTLDRLLADPEKCATQGKGARVLTLTEEEIGLLLQGLNDVKIAAWERLGCPNFEEGKRPEVCEENFLCLWVMQATDLFQSFLLAVVQGDD
jgi:hypothetical protein